MIKLTRLCLPLVFTSLFCSAVPAQDLPEDWSTTYVAHQWQGKCEIPGRGGCREGNTYFYESNAGILLKFTTYDQKTIRLIVASTKGSCVGGTVSIQDTLALELVGVGDYCEVAGGKQFRETERITNSTSQLDIGMFRKAETIAIDIELSKGDKLNAEIPMQGFGDKLDAAKQPTS